MGLSENNFDFGFSASFCSTIASSSIFLVSPSSLVLLTRSFSSLPLRNVITLRCSLGFVSVLLGRVPRGLHSVDLRSDSFAPLDSGWKQLDSGLWYLFLS